MIANAIDTLTLTTGIAATNISSFACFAALGSTTRSTTLAPHD